MTGCLNGVRLAGGANVVAPVFRSITPGLISLPLSLALAHFFFARYQSVTFPFHFKPRRRSLLAFVQCISTSCRAFAAMASTSGMAMFNLRPYSVLMLARGVPTSIARCDVVNLVVPAGFPIPTFPQHFPTSFFQDQRHVPQHILLRPSHCYWPSHRLLQLTPPARSPVFYGVHTAPPPWVSTMAGRERQRATLLQTTTRPDDVEGEPTHGIWSGTQHRQRGLSTMTTYLYIYRYDTTPVDGTSAKQDGDGEAGRPTYLTESTWIEWR